ncbi:2-C-methyl-D-erythritol 4-phosphate cytidylyltransferase [Simiduia sp. 21SJ11W-1]|uniref:2-C-methyl-D-erythritol 4-phosphate cytidylyltransferase n=1 Tax=Simiduia sp. 21SJ11W-1 TaxID=2909669 RepID=UPI00209C73A4|nr:2-C-methyl-D-erythritol 4-phosphate cytidylyltransferase [Simiduia sp. 21SJ11W-1]UTA49146.1 2-C-methyl-D-erythritol 4-phosphate cytidylyltransferase [Simiduia sp. 21SJ11W-1]
MSALWVVVPAAGIGSRMQAAMPKQYLPLAGRTVIEHTLERLLAIESLAGLIVALHPDDAHFHHLPLSSNPRITPITGGAERADSVRRALSALCTKAGPDDWVLVHDAARPCITPEVLNSFVARVLQSASHTHCGAILAAPVADTLKRVGEGATIAETVDRRGLWAAQTPQMFRYQALQNALVQAQNSGLVITDEASAIEGAGLSAMVVNGPSDNLKITRPEDLPLAELILQAQKQSDRS